MKLSAKENLVLAPLGCWIIEIERWRPATVNELMKGVKTRIRLKRIDRGFIAVYGTLANVPPARGKRSISLHLTLGPRNKPPDPDNLWKSLLDALVTCGYLVDDSSEWCDTHKPTFESGKELGTRITLREI